MVVGRTVPLMILLLGIVCGTRAAEAQFPFVSDVVATDSLLRTHGPPWQVSKSPHFVLYTERAEGMPLSPKLLLDSLEDAWTHASRLLGTPTDRSPITVLVTLLPERFPNLLVQSSRGIARQTNAGGDLIILVHNYQVRPFSRHEVAHVVARRLWGAPSAAWVNEGVATWADGRCQGTTILAVARDLLRADPELTAAELPARFKNSRIAMLGPRFRAYILAGSMISFVYDKGGAQALHALWIGGIPPAEFAIPGETLSVAWRRYVERRAASKPGLLVAALDSRGCG
jgi:hypothetical protein